MLTTYTSISRYANYKNMWTCIQRDTCIPVYTQRHVHMCELMYNQLTHTCSQIQKLMCIYICIFSYKIQNYTARHTLEYTNMRCIHK